MELLKSTTGHVENLLLAMGKTTDPQLLTTSERIFVHSHFRHRSNSLLLPQEQPVPQSSPNRLDQNTVRMISVAQRIFSHSTNGRQEQSNAAP